MLRSDKKIRQNLDLNPFFSRQNKMHYNSFGIHYNEFHNK